MFHEKTCRKYKKECRRGKRQDTAWGVHHTWGIKMREGFHQQGYPQVKRGSGGGGKREDYIQRVYNQPSKLG
jgi:hypothetical protein